MVSPKNTALFFTLLAVLCWSKSVYSRENIVIGEVSVGYDFTERKYDENDDEVATVVTVPTADTTDSSISEESAGTVEDNPNETDDGDVRRLLVTPRIRVSSRGVNDLLEFTYAPTFPFLTYDEYENNDNVGHDLNLLAEKSFTRNWSVSVSDSYYYGDDAVEDDVLRSAAIVPGADETEEGQTVGAEQTGTDSQGLREQNGRREYWRNNLSISTDYTYAPDSLVGVGYTFGVLRDISDYEGGYDDYDRHEGTGQISYRFNRSWQMETQVGYVRGYYGTTDVNYIQPEIILVPVESDTTDEDTTTEEDTEDEEAEPEIEYEEQTVYNQSAEEYNDDLEEYRFLFRVNYDWPARDRLYSLYSYNATDYESALREDSAIQAITCGWDHDFSSALHMTISGGPSFVTYEERSTDSGYNAFAGLAWDFRHASLTANTSYGYEFNNFDGDRTGLSQTWRSELGYSYQFSPQISLSLSSGYERSENEEPLATTVLLELDGEDTAGDDVNKYTEESYDVGLTLGYNFLRWYTLSASYRYADYQSENDLDYDEHRVLLTLSASKEVFRW